MVVFYQTCHWFMNLPDPNNAQAGFVSVVVGAGAAWFGLYVNKGRSTVNVQAKSEVRDNVYHRMVSKEIWSRNNL